MLIEVCITLVIVPVVYLVYNYIKHVFEYSKYPPGPFPLPLIGNIHQMMGKPHLSWNKLAEKYGDVFSLSLGTERIVVLNSIEPMLDAFVTKGNNFSGRPLNYLTEFSTRGYKDIASADYGPVWVSLRKMTHSALKICGNGTDKMEDKMKLESEQLHKRLRKYLGVPVDFNKELGAAIMNIICNVLFNDHYEPEDKELEEIIKINDVMMKTFKLTDLIVFFPWLRHLPNRKLAEFTRYMHKRDDFLHAKLVKHREHFDGTNVKDFTDALLKLHADKSMVKNASEITDDHLEMVLMDMILAGFDTTATTIRWIVLYLMHWPEYQEKLNDEMTTVLGPKVYPTLDDRPNLPLVMSTIQEVLRFSSIVPSGSPHKSTKDGEIMGHPIPKDTTIFYNEWNMHFNENIWENPQRFHPERWLNEEGQFFATKGKSFVPFSAGRRICLGQTIARAELFLFMSRMIKDFRIEFNPEEGLPSLEGIQADLVYPHPYTVIFRSREDSLM